MTVLQMVVVFLITWSTASVITLTVTHLLDKHDKTGHSHERDPRDDHRGER